MIVPALSYEMGVLGFTFILNPSLPNLWPPEPPFSSHVSPRASSEGIVYGLIIPCKLIKANVGFPY